MRRTCLIGCVLLFAAAFAAPAGAEIIVTISDGDFADTNWQVTELGSTTYATHTEGQETTGGNPDKYREMVHNFDFSGQERLYLFHKYTATSHNPSTQGAIESIDYTEDHKMWTGLGAIGSGFAIKQGSTVYVTTAGSWFSNTSWATESHADLTADDFGQFDGDDKGGSNHPDFTSSGGEITFGYLRWNKTSGTVSGTHGIDNWEFALTVPEPATMGLLGLGFAGMAVLRRRKS